MFFAIDIRYCKNYCPGDQMTTWDALEFDARVTRRRSGEANLDGDCVIYWMRRAQRAFDNPALNTAILAGNLLRKPVVVFFRLFPHAHHANLRHYRFLVDGFKDVKTALRQRNVGFVLSRHPDPGILEFCAKVRPCLVVGDENPMRESERSTMNIGRRLQAPFWTVDADVIVPTKLLGKEHYAARTIRPKIRALLPEYLHPVENPIATTTWKKHPRLDAQDPTHSSLLDNFPVDHVTPPVTSLTGGTAPAMARLRKFIKSGLDDYALQRNRPDLSGTSQLSPYLHFGHIGPHTIALAVQRATVSAQDRNAFLEELIVRRELAINF